jgi:hypothetical protein
LEEIWRLLRNAAAFQIRRRPGNHDAARTGKPNVDHVAVDGFHEPNARVFYTFRPSKEGPFWGHGAFDRRAFL